MAKTMIMIPGTTGFFGSVADMVKQVIKVHDAQIVVNMGTALKKVQEGKVEKVIIIMGSKNGHPISSIETYEMLKKAGKPLTIQVLDSVPWPDFPAGVLHYLDPFKFKEQLLTLLAL